MRNTLRTFALPVCALLPAAASCGDLNGDGFDDLCVGVFREDTSQVPDAGALQIFFGSANGLVSATSEIVTAETLGLESTSFSGFGLGAASGDFDGDGFHDLAIGHPGAPVKGLFGAGRVYIVRGSSSGLDFANPRVFDQNTKGIKDKVERKNAQDPVSDEFFGAVVKVGDFDGNGYDDLAISTTGEKIGKSTSAGAVHVLYGDPKGLTAKRNQFWHQNRKGVAGACATSERFGSGLAVGDLDGDGYDDLAVTVPNEVDAVPGVGRVAVLFGSKKGLTAKRDVLVKPESNEVSLQTMQPDGGMAITCGDFDADAYDDLAIGTYDEAAGGAEKQGCVCVIRGSPLGLALQLAESFVQGDGDVPGSGAKADGFGAQLAAADFDGDGDDDLAVSAIGETVGGVASGRVTILYSGGASGLGGGGAATFDQDTSGVVGVAEAMDLFGLALAALDANGDGAIDLAVGVTGEDAGTATDAGAINVLLSQLGVGVTTTGNQLLYQDAPGVPGEGADDEWFGFTLGS